MSKVLCVHSHPVMCSHKNQSMSLPPMLSRLRRIVSDWKNGEALFDAFFWGLIHPSSPVRRSRLVPISSCLRGGSQAIHRVLLRGVGSGFRTQKVSSSRINIWTRISSAAKMSDLLSKEEMVSLLVKTAKGLKQWGGYPWEFCNNP